MIYNLFKNVKYNAILLGEKQPVPTSFLFINYRLCKLLGCCLDSNELVNRFNTFFG